MRHRSGYRLGKALGVTFAGVVWLFLCVQVSAQSVEIAILTSDSLTSTQRTEYGIRKVISQEYPQARFATYLIDRAPNDHPATVDSIIDQQPRLIVTIGSTATEMAKDNFADIPVVFSAVKYPVLSGFVESVNRPGRNITGASLDVPIDVQFTYFRWIVPGLRRIGVLYTANTAPLIPHARIIAQQFGMELLALNVESDRDLPEALDSLMNNVEGIWSVADANLFKPASTRYILLHTVRRGIPFMGFSRYVVESGALCALDFDYKAVGFQAGAIANRIIAGERPDSISVTTADVIWFHYNANTAKRINIEIPSELASIAKEVYR